MIKKQGECTSSEIWEASDWQFEIMNYDAWTVATPSVSTGLSLFELGRMGGYELLNVGKKRAIDSTTHHALLDESLREYREIWSTLAAK